MVTLKLFGISTNGKNDRNVGKTKRGRKNGYEMYTVIKESWPWIK